MFRESSIALVLTVLWWTQLFTVRCNDFLFYEKADNTEPARHSGSYRFDEKVFMTTFTKPRPWAGANLYPGPIDGSSLEVSIPTYVALMENIEPFDFSSSNHQATNSFMISRETSASHNSDMPDTNFGKTDSPLGMAKAYAIKIQEDADEIRRKLENTRPDKYEIHISAIDRLYRVALYSMKTSPPPDPEDVEWAHRWRRWWRESHALLAFDTRTAPEEFFDYTVKRQLSFIEDDASILEFEKTFNREYLARHEQLSQLRRGTLDKS